MEDIGCLREMPQGALRLGDAEEEAEGRASCQGFCVVRRGTSEVEVSQTEIAEMRMGAGLLGAVLALVERREVLCTGGEGRIGFDAALVSA